MRDNWLSNRIFKSYEDIVALCCQAWNNLIDQPWDHVPRHAQMGAWVLINDRWYYALVGRARLEYPAGKTRPAISMPSSRLASYADQPLRTIQLTRIKRIETSTDDPQMTSKFVEMVPWPDLQGNSIPFAAIR